VDEGLDQGAAGGHELDTIACEKGRVSHGLLEGRRRTTNGDRSRPLTNTNRNLTRFRSQSGRWQSSQTNTGRGGGANEGSTSAWREDIVDTDVVDEFRI
jgi:hypothetical protein